jgi:hypothetical protein
VDNERDIWASTDHPYTYSNPTFQSPGIPIAQGCFHPEDGGGGVRSAVQGRGDQVETILGEAALALSALGQMAYLLVQYIVPWMLRHFSCGAAGDHLRHGVCCGVCW